MLGWNCPSCSSHLYEGAALLFYLPDEGSTFSYDHARRGVWNEELHLRNEQQPNIIIVPLSDVHASALVPRTCFSLSAGTLLSKSMAVWPWGSGFSRIFSFMNSTTWVMLSREPVMRQTRSFVPIYVNIIVRE